MKLLLRSIRLDGRFSVIAVLLRAGFFRVFSVIGRCGCFGLEVLGSR